jgi:hypothetical protein
MPLPTALKKWISDCKAYAAKHNCSYKQAMSALKKLKKSRKSYQGGGHNDLNGSPLEGFAGQEGNTGMDSKHAGGDPSAAHADAGPANGSPTPPPPPPPPGAGHTAMSGGGGMSMFEAGQVGGRRRRRRGSKSKRQSQSQSQNGGKRRKSRRGRGRRRSSRGGSALSYSQY